MQHEIRGQVGLFAQWLTLGAAVGALAGSAAALFLRLLDWATATRTAQPLLVLGLPLAGLTLGWVYQRYAGAAGRGSNLIFEEVNRSSIGTDVPLRMTPLILLASVWTHLFGGSAGREGAAAQMGASLADALRRVLRLNASDRRLMLLAGISGGFGGVFGTPIAGFVFGLEAQNVGRIQYDALVPCLTAALVGDWVARAVWGATHSVYPVLPALAVEPILLLKVLLAGVVFGLTSLLFIQATKAVKQAAKQWLPSAMWSPLAGGVVVVVLTLVLNGWDYLGLSLPLLHDALHGAAVRPEAFALKLLFTAVTVGSGFVGGEVTPLFVIGGTLGAALSSLLGLEAGFLAALGMVAVFAGASNTPLACLLMGVELFGGGSVAYLAVACGVAYLICGHRGIYGRQRLAVYKFHGSAHALGTPLDEL